MSNYPNRLFLPPEAFEGEGKTNTICGLPQPTVCEEHVEYVHVDLFSNYVDNIIQQIAELPDRTSPEDQPDMMMVTADELRVILAEVGL